MKQLTIMLLRHGETILNKHLIGATDVPLSPLGNKQMRDAIKRCDNINHIVSSPLIRCHNFAKDFAQSINCSLITDNDLREFDFGDWDGQSFEQLWQSPDSELESFYRDPWQQSPPKGETAELFCQRIDRAWQSLLQQDGIVLAVCHGGVIRYLMAKILGMPLPGNRHLVALDIPHGALVKISVTIDDDGAVWPTIHWPT